MRIEVKGRNLPVSDELREHVEKRFRKVARQVSELAELELELFEERNPAIADSQVADRSLGIPRCLLREDAGPLAQLLAPHRFSLQPLDLGGRILHEHAWRRRDTLRPVRPIR